MTPAERLLRLQKRFADLELETARLNAENARAQERMRDRCAEVAAEFVWPYQHLDTLHAVGVKDAKREIALAFAIGLDRILEGGEAGELIREARDELASLKSALATAQAERDKMKEALTTLDEAAVRVLDLNLAGYYIDHPEHCPEGRIDIELKHLAQLREESRKARASLDGGE